ncbi:hypothetical protein [Rhizobium sp. RU36D]|uniref:hypothetical protein n=1 Tax=Rhizobium sp. RU36D TaxID=1907415 RepID=UPI0009D7A0A4|nr:hypothetical protein [Rhizobium sp. RU36D]SMD16189.1 hypothetical protein SAMN05880593_1291 [Rhizobium sp. RU36D]
MSDADMPWSSPPAAPSEPSVALPSDQSKVSSVKPSISDRDDLRASFLQEVEEYRRKQEEEGRVTGHEHSHGSLAPEPQSGSPKDDGPKAPDFSDLVKHFDEVKQVRQEEEAIRQKIEGEKRGVEADARRIHGERAADAAAAAQAAGQSAAASAQIVAGFGQHHAEEQRGWAEYDRTETAGERQQETEERRRSSGMSL